MPIIVHHGQKSADLLKSLSDVYFKMAALIDEYLRKTVLQHNEEHMSFQQDQTHDASQVHSPLTDRNSLDTAKTLKAEECMCQRSILRALVTRGCVCCCLRQIF